MAVSNGVNPSFEGIFLNEITLTPAAVEGPTNVIPAGVTAVRLTANTNNANDFTVLPPLASVPLGHRIVICAGAVASELRTPAGSGETINNLNCDGTNEMLMTAANTYQLVKKQNATVTNWIASGQTNLGGAQATIVPHA